MGVDLKPILVSECITLEELRDKIIVVDASNILHQFLGTIRKADGTPLTDSEGNVTSHLVGLFYRTLKMMNEFKIKPVYVFDGEMPSLKTRVMEERAQRRREADRKWEKAIELEDDEEAFKEAVRTSVLTESMIDDAKKLLQLFGLPTIQAPGEAEAQCAYMTRDEQIYAMNSRDYDSLLFGAKRLLRYMTISNRDNIEIIELESFLCRHDISLDQLVDMGLLIGTDYNEGVFRVGPKTSLKLIKKYGGIENLPKKYLDKLDDNYLDVKRLFTDPLIDKAYSLRFEEIKKDQITSFLCQEREFPLDRVTDNLEKI